MTKIRFTKPISKYFQRIYQKQVFNNNAEDFKPISLMELNLHGRSKFTGMRIFFSLLLFISYFSFSQNYQPKSIDFEGLDLLPPMDIPIILAGNFGEMRSNHFHTGLDIKTEGVEGKVVRAIEDGYISRVRVSPWGYGNAIYIDHPNGLTSVYAHLSKFPEKIEQLVRSKHASTQSYILDEITLDDSVFVQRGEQIAFSGNSGSSSAPHLHFEIRETVTEHAINPLLFDCYRKRVQDQTSPKISGIKLYAVDENGYMIPNKSTYFYAKYTNGKWIINNDNPIDVSDLITENAQLAFGLHATDKLDAAHNICGVHHTFLRKDGELSHEQQIDYIDFSANRYLNSHQDYFEFKQNNRNIHKQFTTTLNPLAIYVLKNGKFNWADCAGSYQFDVYDVHKNKSVIHFTITAKDQSQPAKNPFLGSSNYFLPHKVNTFIEGDFQVLMEPGTFYEPMQKVYKLDSSSSYISPIYQFGEYSTPFQQAYDIRIKAPLLPSSFPLNKLGIISISDRGYVDFLGGNYVDGWVEAHPRLAGKFAIAVDSIPPVIKPLDFSEGRTITKYRTLELEINDDLAGIMEYKAYLNGKWVLMIYDRRKKRYIIPLDAYSKPILEQGKNKIRIQAKDAKGNFAESAYTLIY